MRRRERKIGRERGKERRKERLCVVADVVKMH